MIRFAVIVFAMLGVAFSCGRAYPPTVEGAFSLVGFTFTWVMLAAIAMGIVAYKVTK